MIGFFLILLGALMLLDSLHLIDIRLGRMILPTLLIAWGASMVFRRRSKSDRP